MGRFRWEDTRRRRRLRGCLRIWLRRMRPSPGGRCSPWMAGRRRAGWLRGEGENHQPRRTRRITKEDRMRIKDRVALITGGTSGIGEATALLFAREGACVAITGRNAERGKNVVNRIRHEGGEAIFVRADVSAAKDCRHAVDATVKAFGGSTSCSTMRACFIRRPRSSVRSASG